MQDDSLTSTHKISMESAEFKKLDNGLSPQISQSANSSAFVNAGALPPRGAIPTASLRRPHPGIRSGSSTSEKKMTPEHLSEVSHSKFGPTPNFELIISPTNRKDNSDSQLKSIGKISRIDSQTDNNVGSSHKSRSRSGSRTRPNVSSRSESPLEQLERELADAKAEHALEQQRYAAEQHAQDIRFQEAFTALKSRPITRESSPSPTFHAQAGTSTAHRARSPATQSASGASSRTSSDTNTIPKADTTGKVVVDSQKLGVADPRGVAGKQSKPHHSSQGIMLQSLMNGLGLEHEEEAPLGTNSLDDIALPQVPPNVPVPSRSLSQNQADSSLQAFQRALDRASPSPVDSRVSSDNNKLLKSMHMHSSISVQDPCSQADVFDERISELGEQSELDSDASVAGEVSDGENESADVTHKKHDVKSGSVDQGSKLQLLMSDQWRGVLQQAMETDADLRAFMPPTLPTKPLSTMAPTAAMNTSTKSKLEGNVATTVGVQPLKGPFTAPSVVTPSPIKLPKVDTREMSHLQSHDSKLMHAVVDGWDYQNAQNAKIPDHVSTVTVMHASVPTLARGLSLSPSFARDAKHLHSIPSPEAAILPAKGKTETSNVMPESTTVSASQLSTSTIQSTTEIATITAQRVVQELMSTTITEAVHRCTAETLAASESRHTANYTDFSDQLQGLAHDVDNALTALASASEQYRQKVDEAVAEALVEVRATLATQSVLLAQLNASPVTSPSTVTWTDSAREQMKKEIDMYFSAMLESENERIIARRITYDEKSDTVSHQKNNRRNSGFSLSRFLMMAIVFGIALWLYGLVELRCPDALQPALTHIRHTTYPALSLLQQRVNYIVAEVSANPTVLQCVHKVHVLANPYYEHAQVLVAPILARKPALIKACRHALKAVVHRLQGLDPEL